MFYSLGIASKEWKKLVDGVARGIHADAIAKVEAFATRYWAMSPFEEKWRLCLLCQTVVDTICFPKGYTTQDLTVCEMRFYRLKEEYQDYLLPFILYRMWLAGGNIERLLRRYMVILEGGTLPEKFMDSVLFVGMVAVFRGDEALLRRVKRVVAAHYGQSPIISSTAPVAAPSPPPKCSPSSQTPNPYPQTQLKSYLLSKTRIQL